MPPLVRPAKPQFYHTVADYRPSTVQLQVKTYCFTFSEFMNFTFFKSEIFKIVGKQKIGVVKGEKISKAIYDFLSSPKERTKKRKNLPREPFLGELRKL